MGFGQSAKCSAEKDNKGLIDWNHQGCSAKPNGSICLFVK